VQKRDGILSDLDGPRGRLRPKRALPGGSSTQVSVSRHAFLGSVLASSGGDGRRWTPTRGPGALGAAVAAPGPLGMGAAGSAPAEWRALLEVTRPKNYAPSVLMTLLGAWVGAGGDAAALAAPQVWLVALCSAGVALASCAINDYFDVRNDAVNDPSKPLVAGTVAKDRVVLLCLGLYSALLVAACLLPSWPVRGVIAGSCVATLLYTPVLKRIALVKNAVVAGTIAASVAVGGLAAGAPPAALPPQLWQMSAFTFFVMMAREALMDVSDVEGDARAGCRTVPVLLGRPAGAALALAMAVAAGLAAAG